MGNLIRQFDWATSSMEGPEKWPTSLRITLSTILASKFPMFIFWGKDLICFYNDAYRPSLGNDGKHPNALGKPGVDVWGEIWDFIKPLIDQVLNQGEATWKEDQLLPIYRNGKMEDVYWTFSYSPIYNDEGNPEGVLVTCCETTKSVIRLNTLRASEQRFQNLVRQTTVGIIILIGKEMKVAIVNDKYGELIGRKTTELLGQNLFDIIPEAEEDFRPILEKVLFSGESLNLFGVPYEVNCAEEKKSGFLNLNYQPYEEDGSVVGVMVVCQNITEVVLANQKIQDSEEKFKALADNVPNLAWMANPDGWIIWYNSQWYSYTGSTESDMEGWGWKSVHDPDYLTSVVEKWTTSINSGEKFEMVFPLKGADGIFKPFLTRVVPIINKEGKVSRWIGTNTDISEIIKAEEILAKQNKELQKINNDLDNFVYTASHDLKAPISNLEGLINSLLDLLVDKCEEEETQILDMMQTSIERFKNTIYDLTEISRIQKGYIDDFKEVNFIEIFNEVKNDVSSLITSAKGILTPDFKIQNIAFSSRNLRSILYNLVSNALKYKHPERNAIIKINTYLQDEYIVLSVEDNGLGIDKSKKENIFTMFQRLHTHVEGSGIGLYIVKRIIENAGGKIEVESILGEGTTFNVYFRNG